MSITTPKGFRAAGVAAGLKQSGNLDFAVIVNDGPIPATAAVFTSNRAKANPILWSERAIKAMPTKAIVLNSGGANCFTGEEGYSNTEATAKALADALHTAPETVLVCSTGLIGEQLDRSKLLNGVEKAVAELSAEAGDNPALAIMTTDTKPKQSRVRGEGWTIAGMAKGAGMLAPGLATMLVVITTDAIIDTDDLQEALNEAVRVSFNRLDSDGCMSTNDQVTVMASGASDIAPKISDFTAALTALCQDLATQLQADAEGASHQIDIEVTGAVTESDAEDVGRSVARNNLFKTAIFGNDPNWGRVLAAIGTTAAEFDPYQVSVSMNGVRVCHKGAPDRPREEVDLSPRETHVLIELGAGDATATIKTNDLTHDYVHENSAYSS
ncbi:MAG: bifunctional glutamate N-acetyltransferase/amino-acid acetyltransferase ArgJ [Microbacteriaceae bacterium]|nr:bifunctional glutamate N-acetyltransferase/amino-acid acetyltransferase ArgJ [Microbacteriaceae bacterium]